MNKLSLLLAFAFISTLSFAQESTVDMSQSGLRCYNMKAGAVIDTAVFSRQVGSSYLDFNAEAVLKLRVIPNHPGTFSKSDSPVTKGVQVLEENQYNSGEKFIFFSRNVQIKPSGVQQMVDNYIITANDECAVMVSCHYPLEMQAFVQAAVKKAAETSSIPNYKELSN